jgi:site-specific recombinase XerD
MQDFEVGLSRRGYTQKTRSAYRNLIVKFLAFVNDVFPQWKPFVDRDDDKFVVETYKRHLQDDQQKKHATINAALSAVARFFSIQGHSCRFRLQQAPESVKPEYLSPVEFEHLIKALPSCSIKHQSIILLFLANGLRPQELSALQLTDVDLDGAVLNVGGDVFRRMPLDERTLQALRAWLVERERLNSACQSLFINANGLPISSAGLDFIVKTVGQKCRVCLSARLLRNTYIQSLLNNCPDLLAVAELAGVKNISSIWRHVATNR